MGLTIHPRHKGQQALGLMSLIVRRLQTQIEPSETFSPEGFHRLDPTGIGRISGPVDKGVHAFNKLAAYVFPGKVLQFSTCRYICRCRIRKVSMWAISNYLLRSTFRGVVTALLLASRLLNSAENLPRLKVPPFVRLFNSSPLKIQLVS